VQNALRLPPPGSFFIIMVTGGATMVARLGLNPLEVGAWALVGAASGIALGMLPGRAPERGAVDTVEKAVEEFADGEVSVAKLHQARTALHNAWNMLADAGVIRAGRVIDESRADLVTRPLTAHRRLAALNSPDNDPEELTDTPNYVDLSRTAIPLARPSISYRLYRSLHRHSHATMTAAKVTAAGCTDSSDPCSASACSPCSTWRTSTCGACSSRWPCASSSPRSSSCATTSCASSSPPHWPS